MRKTYAWLKDSSGSCSLWLIKRLPSISIGQYKGKLQEVTSGGDLQHLESLKLAVRRTNHRLA